MKGRNDEVARGSRHRRRGKQIQVGCHLLERYLSEHGGGKKKTPKLGNVSQ